MQRDKKIRRTALLAAGVVVLVAFVGNSMGYRLTSRGIVQSRPGKIQLTVPGKGSRVFLDNKHKTTTTRDNQTVVFRRLASGPHAVLVDEKGHYPWYKAIDLSQNHNAILASFSVDMSLAKLAIPETDPQYQSIKTVLDKATLPTVSAKKRSKNGSVALWADSATQSIHAEWLGQPLEIPGHFCPLGACSAHVVVFTSGAPIASIDFYEDRSDVILFAADTSIYALDMNIAPPQNAQPLYTGTAPIFEQPEAGILFVRDNGDYVVLRY